MISLRIDKQLLVSSLIFLFVVSCSKTSPKTPLSFTLKNNSSEILTLILEDDENSSTRILPSFCFKFSEEAFPLSIMFSQQGPMTLNKPAHYIISGAGQKAISKTPCLPPDLN